MDHVAEHGLTVSVVIITYRRPTTVAENLSHLSMQNVPPWQVVVVDASPDYATKAVVARYPGATYVRNPTGAGNMPNSRNAALSLLTGDVVAFLDDDAFPEPDYVQHLVAAYEADPNLALACSRTLNGLPNEEAIGVNEIGVLRADGTFPGNFAANPGTNVRIDHGIGATMSFRRSTLATLGGFREYFGGTGLHEDADAFFRARALGLRAMFIHDAVALHVAAPHAHGKRFDLRYHHWGSRNTAILMVANFGFASKMYRQNVRSALRFSSQGGRTTTRRFVRLTAGVAGYVRGTARGVMLGGFRAHNPVRRDPAAVGIRFALTRGRPGARE